jgi:hypothetical protein
MKTDDPPVGRMGHNTRAKCADVEDWTKRESPAPVRWGLLTTVQS